jgi:hypothetical protein
MVEARTERPRHKARTQMKHDKPMKPFEEVVQAALATWPGCCFAENKEESQENMVAVGRRERLSTQGCVMSVVKQDRVTRWQEHKYCSTGVTRTGSLVT